MFCKRQGFELVAEQLLASGEGLLTVILVVIHCNDLTVTMLTLYKAAAVLSSLMKMCTILCHDRGHINVMVVLQSCTNSLHVLPVSSCDTFPTSSDGTYDVSNLKDEEDIDIKEEDVKAEKDIGNEEEECLDIKHEEGICSEEDEEEVETINTKEDDVTVKEEVS